MHNHLLKAAVPVLYPFATTVALRTLAFLLAISLDFADVLRRTEVITASNVLDSPETVVVDMLRAHLVKQLLVTLHRVRGILQQKLFG